MLPRREKITISWNDISSPRVDEKLRQAQAAAEEAPDFSQSAPRISEPHLLETAPSSFWYNTAVFMTLFGLLGGLLGWVCGAALHFRPDARAEARQWIEARREVQRARYLGTISDSAADASLREIDRAAGTNPYYGILKDDAQSPEQRDQRLRSIAGGADWRNFIANTLFYAVSGMFIAVCLAVAEPLVDRNGHAVVINGSMGAILGLIGGAVVALLADPIHRVLEGDPLTVSAARAVLARAVTWGVLGVFLTLAPAVVMRNARKLLAAVGGGLVGGLVGGALYELLADTGGGGHLSRLAAICAVGAVAGLGTGLIENAAKSGWLRVVGGLIAGKQFILYRNPTFIGSSLACAIYLFKDPQVGRRHAAIHIVRGGFEIEDLPLGGPTYVNGRPVVRQRLRHNDQIQIGATALLFQEKSRPAAG